MNKKIYFNHKFLEFSSEQLQVTSNQVFKYYPTISLLNLKEIEKLFFDEKSEVQININSLFFETVFDYFKNRFSYIEAAGGFISKNDTFLFIYRLDKWDLPKGKLDKDETIEHAAIRECEEECAVKNLKITRQLSSTFHIYPYKKDFAIKQTFWFGMQTDYDKILKPQLEENITDVKWFDRTKIETTVLKNTYLTIKDVISEGLSH
ncbi:MAG: NUDIX domain-containing protein [Bacteroidota bacterium]|nr:NUDIX domain-containing protein [Bacteroidota bacterium]